MAKIRVLVVDDSVVVRRLVSDVINGDPALEVAGIAPNGTLVFTFPPAASADITSYNDAKAIFNGLEARARVLHVARQRGSAA